MSLQVWLPLNGDLDNRGLAGSLTTTTTPTYTNGKLGKGLSSGGCKMSAEMAGRILNNQAVSICCWIYPNKDTGTEVSDIIFGQHSMTPPNNRKFSIFLYPTVNDLHLSWQSDDRDGAFLSLVINDVFPSYTWTHLAVVYDNPTAYIYINGILKYTKTGVSDSSTFTYETPIINSNNGRILNDFRLYDHALSAKEVKEISKGLVLHYPLKGMGTAPNLATHTYENSSWNWSMREGDFTKTYEEDDEGKWQVLTKGTTTPQSGWSVLEWLGGIGRSNYKPNTKYTISFEVFPSHSCILNMSLKSPNGQNIIITKSFSQSIIANTINRVTGIVTTIESLPSVTDQVLYITGQNNTNGAFYKFRKLKIEEGEKATPWIPNKGDSIYSQLGFDSLTEYDCSGMGNNGKKSVALSCSTNTPRYETSSVFTGSQYIAAGRGAMVTDALTVSWWGYMEDWSNYTRAISCTENGGWNFQPKSGVNGQPIEFIVWYNGSYRPAQTSKILSAGWHHFVGTFDGYKTCIYVDGILKGSSGTSTTKYPITYHVSNGIFIGAEVSDSINTPAGLYFNGLLSDIRIYATALSAEDIKDLYNTSISIDKEGNSYAYEYIEQNSPNFYKSGIIENSSINENEADDTDTLETFHLTKTKTSANQIYEV